MDDIYLGIDPGVAGGMAAMWSDGRIISTHKWDGEAEAIAFVVRLREDGRVFAAIERVGGFIKGNPAPGSAMFKFGESFGWLRGFMSGIGIPYCTVRPQDWQKGLGISGEKSARKRSIRDVATQRFPDAKPTLKTADAILISDWLRREHEPSLSKSA